MSFTFFFFNDPAPTEIYTLSLHDALPILNLWPAVRLDRLNIHAERLLMQSLQKHIQTPRPQDRKSTRLNSSHMSISYAVFCLKKKKKNSSNTSHHRRSPHNLCSSPSLSAP